MWANFKRAGVLTLQEAGGQVPPPWRKIAFLVHFSDPIDPKFDFSQISMTIPPIFFRDLKIALKWVSKAFLLSAEPKFGSKNVIFLPFLG